MHVLFVAPHFPSYQRHFVRAMHSVGAKVTGIGEASLGHLDGDVQDARRGLKSPCIPRTKPTFKHFVLKVSGS